MLSRWQRRSAVLFPFLLAGLLAGCGDEDLPTSIPDPLVRPPVPVDIAASAVEENQVTIVWEISSLEGIEAFAVYRSDALNPDTTLIDSTATTVYTDDNLVPGRTYTYRVSSIGSNGLESALSGAFTVTPGTFGLVIDGRAEYTASRTVTLTFTAPGDVASVKIGNDSLLTGSFFEAFDGARSWMLSDGDGFKTVYARFRAAGGTVSELFRATISLDRRAEIASLVEDSGGDPLEPGDTVTVSMNTGEAGGTARVTVAGGLIDLPLLYDETSGLYRASLVITPDLVVEDAVIVGTFTDRAGNVAASYRAGTTLTVVDNGGRPVPVTLDVAPQSDTDWIALSWSRAGSEDFAEYRVYRGNVPSVETDDGDDQVIAVIGDREVVSHVDSLSLRDTTLYYYRVFVEDTEGNLAGSNEVAIFTRNSPPPGVGSFAVAAADSPSTGVELTWAPVAAGDAHDFAEYRIYRSTSGAVSAESDLVGTIAGEISTANFTDESSGQATEYFYRLYVVDRGGLSAGSNVESAVTTDLRPAFPALASPNVDVVNQNVSLTWRANTEPDFASYVVYFRGNENQSSNNGPFTALDVVNDPASVNYAHYPDLETTPYFAEYYIETADRAGHRTSGNIVQAVFGETGLPQVSDIVVITRDSTAIITFTTDVPTTAVLRYSLSFDLDQSESEGAGLQISHAITLSDLEPASEYFYQIEVTDERSIKNFSGVESFTTDAAEPAGGGL